MTRDTSDIAAELEGQTLFDYQIGQKIDGCRRCQEKNAKRSYTDVDYADETFNDGDAVTAHAVHVDDDDLGPHWFITSVDHRDHPELPFDDAVKAETDFIRAHARIATHDREHIIVDVDVVEHSPLGEGPEQSTVEILEQQFIDDSGKHPAGMTVIDLPPDEPEPHWPEAEREWLDALAERHGPLKPRTYSVAKGDSPHGNQGFDYE